VQYEVSFEGLCARRSNQVTMNERRGASKAHDFVHPVAFAECVEAALRKSILEMCRFGCLVTSSSPTYLLSRLKTVARRGHHYSHEEVGTTWRIRGSPRSFGRPQSSNLRFKLYYFHLPIYFI
jgi:hypothetical protein